MAVSEGEGVVKLKRDTSSENTTYMVLSETSC